MFIQRHFVVAVAVLSLLLPAAVLAGEKEVDRGTKAFKKKDYKKAASLLAAEANAGNEDAQFFMGRMAEEGHGMKVDKAKAIKMYEGAANQGHGRAAYRVALMYRDGEGVKKDQAMANTYFMTAAQAGVPEARKIMATRMKKGKFETKVTPAQQAKLDEALTAYNKDEDEKAFGMFLDLAKQNVPEAQYWVARLYHWGEGTAQNEKETSAWAIKAGTAGHPLGAALAAHMYDFHGIPSRDQAETIKWLYTAGHGYLVMDNLSGAKFMLSAIQQKNSNDPNAAKLLKEIQAAERGDDKQPQKKK